MTAITIMDNDYITLWYHPESKIVHHHVKKFVYGKEFQEFLLKGTETMKKYQAHKWLSDDRSNAVVRKEDVEWGQTNWFPQTLQAGWKYWAIVNPEKVIAQMNMKELVKMYSEMGVTAKFFTDPDSAMKWLESQP